MDTTFLSCCDARRDARPSAAKRDPDLAQRKLGHWQFGTWYPGRRGPPRFGAQDWAGFSPTRPDVAQHQADYRHPRPCRSRR